MPDALYASFFLLPSSAFLPYMPMPRPSTSESPRVLGKIQIWGFLLRHTVYLVIGPSCLHFSEFSRWSILDEQVAKTLSPKSCQPLEKWSPASPCNQISPYQTATQFFKGQRLKCRSRQTFWKQGFQKQRKRRNTFLMVIGQSHYQQLHCCRCPLCQVAFFFLE